VPENLLRCQLMKEKHTQNERERDREREGERRRLDGNEKSDSEAFV